MKLFKNAFGYAPLLVNLEPYFGGPFAELPEELKERVEEEFTFPWDDMSVEMRRFDAERLDYQSDPSAEPVLYFEFHRYIQELEELIDQERKDKQFARRDCFRDVLERVKKILASDRERVGAEIQQLIEAQAAGPQRSSIEHADNTDSITPDTHVLKENQYWQRLEKWAIKLIENYPSWKTNQRKVQKTENLQEWIKTETGGNTREVEILKKILSDKFQDI